MFKKLLDRRSSSSSSSNSNSNSTNANDRRYSAPAPIREDHPVDSKTGTPSVPPPAYSSPAATASSSGRGGGGGLRVPQSNATAASSASSLVGGEDPFDFLRSYDTLFLIDDSGSMAGSRWKETRDALASVVATAAKYDDDGVDVHFLNSKKVGSGLKSANDVLNLFSSVKPCNGTPTGTRLEIILSAHIELMEKAKSNGGKGMPKPLNIVCLTDGEPSDDPRSVIIASAKRLDRGNFPLSSVGLFFLQIGNDPAATEALAELDDDLGSDIRDIVDTAAYKAGQGKPSKEWMMKILMGGVNRRLDRKSV